MLLQSIGLALAVAVAGCAALEPGVYDPELDDAKLSMHVLKSHRREAQRMIIDLRAELDARQRTLADSQIARARLEGRLRELERRFDEARQVVELQREELARLRDEREDVLRASRGLQAQLRLVQRQIAGLTESRRARSSAAYTGGPTQTSRTPAGSRENGAARPRLTAQAGVDTEPFLNGEHPEADSGAEGSMPPVVVVQKGDTLWSIARRYQVGLPELLHLNGLAGSPDLIFPGQELLLPW